MKAKPTFPPLGLGTALSVALVLGASALRSADEPAPAPAAQDPALLNAETMRLANKSLILDVADGANRAIAVGERGHILVSESRGDDWRQVENVPTRATLTGVAAVGDKAWAVGHDGVILASVDGGLTWTRQRAMPYDPDSDDMHNGSPLLDVLFLNESTGYAVGAYAWMLRTNDGGATWEEVSLADAVSVGEPPPGAEDVFADDGADADMDGGEGGESWTFDQSELELEEESDPHLNAIVRTGDGSLFVVAERGAAYRSTDSGQTWQRLQLPYEGSMFGAIGYEDRHVLAFGLRGNVFETRDLGETWTKIDTGVDLSIMGGAGWNDGAAALVGANGVVLTRTKAGENLLKHAHPDGVVLSSVLARADGGTLIVAGELGVGTYTPN
jgi:photosystem II stability/assembly factor-like uncharacterized protein